MADKIKGLASIAETALSFMARDKMPPTEAVRTASYLEGVPVRSGKELDALDRPLATGELTNPLEALIYRYHKSVAPWYGMGKEGNPIGLAGRTLLSPGEMDNLRYGFSPASMLGDAQDQVRAVSGSKYFLDQLADIASEGDQVRRMAILKQLGLDNLL